MTELLIESTTNLAAITKGEIDSQVATAKAYPRDVAACKTAIEDMALANADTAASMFYAVPRGNDTVEGPSVRLAEVVANNWTNLRFESRIVGIDANFVTAQATVMDLEKNTAGRGECKRRITNKRGKRFNDDMIQVTCNAACSIALREAVFKIVPRVIFDPIWREAKRVSLGDITSMKGAISKSLQWFAKAGVTESQVLKLLEKATVEDIDSDDLTQLRGVASALSDGTTTIEEIFGDQQSISDEVAAEAAEGFRKSLDFKPCESLEDCDRLATSYLNILDGMNLDQDITKQLQYEVDDLANKRQAEIRDGRGGGNKGELFGKGSPTE